MRKALVRTGTGAVENVVVVVAGDGSSAAPNGYQLIASDTADIGDTWNGNAFIPKPVEAGE